MEQMAQTPETGAPKSGKKTMLIVVALLVVALAGTVYLFLQYQQLTKDPNIINQQKIQAVVEKAGKLIDLPQGEVPSLATITDIEQLKNQPFFANAEVGDQVLLYTNAQKAYLYSPTKNVIVEVASLNIGRK